MRAAPACPATPRCARRVPRSCRPWRSLPSAPEPRRRSRRCQTSALGGADDRGAALRIVDDVGTHGRLHEFRRARRARAVPGRGPRVRRRGEPRDRGRGRPGSSPSSSWMLTAADARACPSTVGAAARALSDHRALVLKLLHEKNAFGGREPSVRVHALAGDPSDFATLEETHPLLWGRERRDACLPRGSPTLFRVESAKARCSADPPRGRGRRARQRTDFRNRRMIRRGNAADP